jgi:hypothetical protein
MEAPLWELALPEWLAAREADLRCAGVTVEPYHAALTLPLLDFTRRHFPGDWVRVVREGMAAVLAGEPPARLLVAREGEGVLGFVHHERERRCIGQLIMFRALAAMREQGFRAAWFLWTDDRTAERFYRAAGFREARRFAVMRKEL